MKTSQCTICKFSCQIVICFFYLPDVTNTSQFNQQIISEYFFFVNAKEFCYLEFEKNSGLEAHYSFVHQINPNSFEMNLSQELNHISSVNEGKKLIGKNHAEEKTIKSKTVIEKAMLKCSVCIYETYLNLLERTH